MDFTPTDLIWLVVILLTLAIGASWIAAIHETPDEQVIRRLQQRHDARVRAAIGAQKKKGSHYPSSVIDIAHEKPKSKRRWIASIAVSFLLFTAHGLHAQQPRTTPNCVIAWSAYTQGTHPAIYLRVLRSPISGGPYSEKAVLPVSATSWTDTEFNNNSANVFYYVLQTVDQYGNLSQYSTETACTTINTHATPTVTPGGSPAVPPAPSATPH